MKEMNNTLRYNDEKDRSYGAAGMAIGLVVFDGEDMISTISLDRESGDIMEMTGEFYFSGNPGVSAKAVWNQLLKNYNLSVVMLISNLLCRSLVMNMTHLSDDVRDAIHEAVTEEGHAVCSLEDDEIDRLFDKNYNYLYRIFSHRGVQSIAHDFAHLLTTRRVLSRGEVIDQLSSLNML